MSAVSKQESFRWIPLKHNRKNPAHTGWQNQATTNTQKIGAWRSKGHNLGIATGHGLLVLDFDVGENKRGLESLELMDMMGLPVSFRVRTPSGGVHVYLQVPLDFGVTVGVNCLADFPGVDIRCEGGLVVGPGSTIEGVPYQVIEEEDLAPPPGWLTEAIRKGAPRQRAKQKADPLIELDLPHSIEKAKFYLSHHAPDAIQGDGGDQTTYEVAARMRDEGISEEICFDLMSVHWNEAGKASPPWEPRELETKIQNAYAYATGRPGNASGLSEFDDVTHELMAEPNKCDRLYRVPFNEAASRALLDASDPLIDGLLDMETLAVVYGASNTGKTFFMLDLAYYISAGRPWQGRDVSSGPVVYVAAEGGKGIFKRIAALKKHYGQENTPLDVVPCPVNLLSSKADIEALIALIKQSEAEHGAPARLIVIDTLSRALSGGDENSSTDMGAFVKNVDHIRNAIKATLAVVHHSGKNAAKGARGHSLLRAATDTEIEIVDRKIKISKQRDMEAIKDLQFKLQPVEIGPDNKGRPVPSCVLQIVTGSEFKKIKLSGRNARFLDAFDNAAQEKAMAAGKPKEWRETEVDWGEWMYQYAKLKLDDSDYKNYAAGVQNEKPPRGMDRTSLCKMRAAVIKGGHVSEIDEYQYVRM